MGDGGLLRDVVDAHVLGCGHEEVDDCLGPVRAVAQETQVTERLLRAPKLALLLAELVRELDKQLAVAVPLMLGQRENAGNVVVLGALLLFRKVADDVATGVVSFGLIKG